MKSPLETLSDLVYKRQQIPFDWIIEYGGDGTIGAAWRTEADAEQPSVFGMLSLLLQLRLLRPRARDTRLRDAAAAVLLAWAREAVSPAYAEALAPWVKAAFTRHPADWYIEVLHALYRVTPVVGRNDLGYLLKLLSAPPSELRANGSGWVSSLAAPPPWSPWERRKTLSPAYARAIADAVPAPSMAEIMALMDRPH